MDYAKLIVAAALALFAQAAVACTWASATIGTRHLNTDTEFEENNWGLGIEQCVSENWRLVGGAYRNSIRNDSVYAGAAYTLAKVGPVAFAVAGGLVTGYPMDPAPMLLPTVMIEGERFGANIVVMPASQWTVAAVGLQLKYRLR